ncbi:WXG100-like domain-containing protein [Nocardia gamkensis]|uniref:WXG100-like domain-containing protein n=1 Tax=Nocardia gamkensis TaxID=352869 RepID=UPI0037CC1127
MTLYMPDGLQWLAWVAGTTWPEGDEDAAWAASEAWKTASKELEALLAGIDEAKRVTVSAYPEGEGGAAMGERYDVLRTGDQSLEALAKLMSTVGDSAFDMGTEIQATKITVIVTLAWLALEILWAWLFPPTAPAVEAAAITTTRSFLKVFEDFVQKIIMNIATRLRAPTVKRHFWSRAVQLRPVLPTAKGYGVYGTRAIEAAAITGTINGAVQVGQLADGKRRHFNGGEFGLSILAGVAGMIPGREVGRYLGKGIDKAAGKNLDNVFGRVGRGVVIGGVSGAVGTAFGNVAAGAVTGDWSSFSSGAGWVGGIARGGMVGGARGGFALGTPIPPGRGDIRSYVWMPKPSTGNTGRPPVQDGSSTGASGSRPGSTATGASASVPSGRPTPAPSTVAGSTGTPAGPAPHPTGSAAGGSRPPSEIGGGASTHSGRGDGASSSSGSGHSVYHDARSQYSGSGQSSRPATPDSVSSSASGHSVYYDATSQYGGSGQSSRPATPDSVGTGSGQPVYHETAGSYSSSPAGSTSGYSAGSGAGPSGHFTGRPPTSWESSVDGWGSTGGPPPTPSGHTPPATPGGGPRPAGSQVTGGSGTHGNPIATGADEPFLGEGKDVRGKPRPKQWPSVEPLPGPFTPPAGGASEPKDWLPGAPAPGAGAQAAAADPELVDVPFTL